MRRCPPGVIRLAGPRAAMIVGMIPMAIRADPGEEAECGCWARARPRAGG